MFGLSLSCQLIQGPAVRTWNCVAHFANLLWYKFNHVRHPVMPRSRRRHHSRSRSRSRSHSYDKDREPKRRKIESFESPQNKRSISPGDHEEQESNLKQEETTASSTVVESNGSAKETSTSTTTEPAVDDPNSPSSENLQGNSIPTVNRPALPEDVADIENEREKSVSDGDDDDDEVVVLSDSDSTEQKMQKQNVSENSQEDLKMEISNLESDLNVSQESGSNTDCNNSIASETERSDDATATGSKVIKSVSTGISPKKSLTPKQLQKKMQLEKQREEKQKEREKKKKEALEEKLKMKLEKDKVKQKEKQEKQEQKQREIEEKQKEKEIKEEKKRKEREEKRKEKEEQKRKEQEEKNKEKLKQEEKKQKAAAAFVNFFTKKPDSSVDEKKSEENVNAASSTFMPFEIKSDMKLAPIVRNVLSDGQKVELLEALNKSSEKLYLEELQAGKRVGKSGKTWPAEDLNAQEDVVIIEDTNPGESIEEQSKTNKIRSKFLKFDGNRRPPYFGTWRKQSKIIKPRKPFVLDTQHFDYEIDSDEEWEEEDPGESLKGSDDEDKENESENEYEVDNDFFVPHGHLSDDEMNDEENEIVSPEAHKAKLKLLKKEFEEGRQGKTQKIKPRVIGCIWYNKNMDNVDQAIHEFLKPLSIISNGPVIIRKRNECVMQTSVRRSMVPSKPLAIELVPDFLKFIHGNTNNQKLLVTEFLNYLNGKNVSVEISKTSLTKQLKQFATWTRADREKKYCWIVHKDIGDAYKVDLCLPN